jgi:hypothetical protein
MPALWAFGIGGAWYYKYRVPTGLATERAEAERVGEGRDARDARLAVTREFRRRSSYGGQGWRFLNVSRG